jgi:hypothetical protein
MIAACSASPHDTATSSQNQAVAAASTSSATYPVPLTIDADAKDRALDDLLSIEPAATLDWSDVRGTFKSVDGLQVPLSCDDGDSLADALWAVLDAHSDLFQLDHDEWATTDVTCGAIQDSTSLKITRKTFAGLPVTHDTMSLFVRRTDGTLTLTGAYATYLPVACEETRASLAQCAEQPTSALEPTLTAHAYTFIHYADTPGPACRPAGHGSYTSHAPDTTTWEDTQLAWNESTTRVTFQKTRRGTIHIASSNVTPELRNSDANCAQGKTDHVGFRGTMDAIKGTILQTRSGSEPYCTVCLTGSPE